METAYGCAITSQTSAKCERAIAAGQIAEYAGQFFAIGVIGVQEFQIERHLSWFDMFGIAVSLRMDSASRGHEFVTGEAQIAYEFPLVGMVFAVHDDTLLPSNFHQ